MFIPQTSTAATANALPRLNASGKLPVSMMTTGASALALLDADAHVPAGNAPAKSVYSTGGAQALSPMDINAEASNMKDANGGYAALDSNGLVIKPVQLVKNGAPSSSAGSIGIDSGKLKFGDGGAVQQAEVISQKDANNGYAALDGSGNLTKPAQKVKTGVVSSAAGALGVDNGNLQYGDGTRVVTIVGLDPSGKISSSLLPAAVVGAVSYAGTWDASTGDAPAPLAKMGQYWIVSVDGSTNLDGITDWKAGDYAIYDGAAYGKIDNTDKVASVFGRIGTVTAQSGDYSVGQITGAASETYVDDAVAAEATARDAAIATGVSDAEAYTDAATADILDGCIFTGQTTTAGRRRKISAKSAAYTITATDEVVPVTTGALDVVITLPPATGSGAEFKVSKEDADAGKVVVTADASGTADSINGEATLALVMQFESYTFVDVAADKWRVW